MKQFKWNDLPEGNLKINSQIQRVLSFFEKKSNNNRIKELLQTF